MSYQNELALAIEAAKEAGEIARHYQALDFDVEYKPEAGNSPVTEADMAIDRFLKEYFAENTPGFGWLSEETEDSPERLKKEDVWVVDPIDGTKSFVQKNGMFVISIGLVANGKPVLGVVYNPMRDELYSAVAGGGLHINGQPTRQQRVDKLEEALCLISLTETKQGLWQPYEGQFKMKPVGSVAYKLALVAAAKADFTASLKPKNEWDLAAGQLLCMEAGLKMTDLTGEPITYNNRQTSINGLICAPAAYFDAVFQQLPKHAKGY